MSDSESTWPADDDFGSRFLEIDEYSTHPIENDSENSLSMSSVLPQFRAFSAKAMSSSRPNTRGIKSRTYAFSEEYFELDDPQDGHTDEQLCRPRRVARYTIDSKRQASSSINKNMNYHTENAVETVTQSTTRSSKPLTARQLSIQMQRNNPMTTTNTANDLVPLSQSSENRSTLTPEQIALHELRAAHRRESAKNKAELEKRQTVERLLKVNANSKTLHRTGRGGRSGISKLRLSEKHKNLKAERNNETLESPSIGKETPDLPFLSLTANSNKHPPSVKTSSRGELPDTLIGSPIKRDHDRGLLSLATADPKAGYIRTVSSARMTPSSFISLPIGDVLPFQTAFRNAEPPNLVLCSQGCGNLRRYACSKTGRSLCSLMCYQKLHAAC